MIVDGRGIHAQNDEKTRLRKVQQCNRLTDVDMLFCGRGYSTLYMYLYVVVRPYATDKNQHYNRNVGLGSPNYISTCVMVSAWQMYVEIISTLAIMVHLKSTMYNQCNFGGQKCIGSVHTCSTFALAVGLNWHRIEINSYRVLYKSYVFS